MSFWIVAGLLTLAVIGLLLRPVLTDQRRRKVGGGQLAVYRDQLRELERDLESGRLADEEYAAARLEVERRLLAATAATEAPPAGTADKGEARGRRLAAAAVVVMLVPLGALATYLAIGRPELPDLPHAGRNVDVADQPRPPDAESPDQLDPEAMVASLDARLKENPEDIEGWSLLGRSYMTLERYREAATAFSNAVRLSGGDPDLEAARGEALVLAADGTVTPEAAESFQRAHAAAPVEPRSRYYLGLQLSQRGDPAGALDWWISLEADSPSGAPWLGLLRERIAKLGTESGLDVAALRAAEAQRRAASSGTAPGGPTADDVAAAAGLDAEQRAEMVNAMVARLAERLAANPNDVEGWMRLARSYDVLDRRDEARGAYAKAAALAPDDLSIQLAYARAVFPPGTPEDSLPDELRPLVAHIRALAPNNPDGLFYAGLIAIKDGDIAAAKSHWGALIARMPPDLPVRAMLEARLKSLGQ